MGTNTIKLRPADLTKPENQKSLFSWLMYCSYAANRDYGMTHEQLLNIGVGNDNMKAVYEAQIQQTNN